MALPKGFRNNIRLTSPNVGVQRRQDLLDNIADDGTFLPRGVHYQDMDETFINFVNKELRIEIDGEEVPVLFLTLQRYSEFTKTWKFTDEYKNIKIPFITIVRKPDPQVGTNQAGLYNIPGRPTFTYYKVPTNDGARVGVDLYKIPQPTSVDITYEVRMFTNKMSDLNLLNEKVQKKFQSRQAYIWPKGHPMPVTLESIGDESNIDDFENRRFYVQPFEMLLAGYILDEEDFEIMPTINRAMVMSELIVGDGVTTPVTDGTNSPGCVVAAQGSSIIKNTAGTILSVVECGSNYVVGNSLVFNSGSTYSQIIPATTNLELPNVVNIDSDGSSVLTPAMVGFTATTCPPFNTTAIVNTIGSYSATTVESGGTITLPDTPIQSTGTAFTATTPSVSTGYTIADVDWIDSDGSPQTSEYGITITATTCSGLADPSPFADANALFLGDRGLTFVDGELDVWENQGSDGNDANAVTSTNRIPVTMGLGSNGYRDFYPTNEVNFRNYLMNTGVLTQFTFTGVMQIMGAYNPERIGPSIGTVNGTSQPAICWGGNGGFRVTQRIGGTSTTTYWSRAAMGIDYTTPFHYILIYDGTEAVNADRLKLYVNGVFVASTTTPTHPTSVQNTSGVIFITSSTTTYSSYNRIGGYVGYWERVFTPAEIAETQTWAEQIWNVAP